MAHTMEVTAVAPSYAALVAFCFKLGSKSNLSLWVNFCTRKYVAILHVYEECKTAYITVFMLMITLYQLSQWPLHFCFSTLQSI